MFSGKIDKLKNCEVKLKINRNVKPLGKDKIITFTLRQKGNQKNK